ncbi:MAG: type VI secretion system contractile sheath large subunit [Pseudomonadota bacterium]
MPPSSPEAQEVDAFSDLLQKDFRIAKSDGPKLTSLISNLAVAVLDNLNEYFPGTAAETITSLIARIDRILSDQMNEVLHCEKLRRVEGTWRGLHFLVINTETDQKLKIRVLNIKKSELSKTLQDYDGSMWDRSPVFDLIYTREYATLGGVPFGAIIGAYEFSHAADDVALLRNMSGIAAAAHAPFIAAASPRLFGFDGWIELPNPRDLKLIQSSPDYAAWQSLRQSEDSRYIGLTMPRMLARPTYGAATFPVDGFDFEETTHALPDNYIWMNAAFAMGVNINRSYKQYGWGARIRGFESGGAVTDLPVDTSPIDNPPHSMVGPTEVSIDDRREAELSKLGLIPLLQRKNTSSAAFIGVGSLQDREARVALLADPDAQSNERLLANLPHLLAVSRFAQYLKVIARDKIGAFSERSDLQSHLNEWISQYVLNDPTVADDKQRAKRPLASAEIQIDRSETRPGYYTARFFLRPYYQLEGTTVSLRLVSELLTGER